MSMDKKNLGLHLVLAQCGSCTCMTKTHEHKYHDETCRYRVLCEAIDEIDKLRMGITMALAVHKTGGLTETEITVLENLTAK